MRCPRCLLVITMASIIFLALGTVLPDTPAAAAPNQPNILFILTDDLRMSDIAYMPKLKMLLTDNGTNFSNYFVSVSLCCPSRTTTLRGQYSHNTGVETNGGINGGFATAYKLGVEDSTIATWLAGGGYRTGLFGKYLNGYPFSAGVTYIPPGWSDWNSASIGDAYGEFNYTLNENGKLVRYAHDATDYGTDVYTNLTVNFIQQSVQAHQPFFAYLAVYAPHKPATPAPRDADLFPGVQAPRTPNYNEPDVSDKPDYIAYRRPLNAAAQQTVDALYQKRLQSIQAVDDSIETLYNTLKADGQLGNTYIVFTSDNGFHLGNHRLEAGKETPYEEDIHVPLIVVGPGVAAGKTVDQLTGNIDLAPTFAAMGGVTPADFVDGRSFLPLLLGQVPPMWRDVYLVEHWPEIDLPGAATPPPDSLEPEDLDQLMPQPDETELPSSPAKSPAQFLPKAGPIPEYHGFRGNGYVYVEYVTGEKEFYDLTQDPYELNNLAGKLDAATLQALHTRLQALDNCAADSCRAAEDQALNITMPTTG